MYAMYGTIYHQYTSNVSIYNAYIPYMDPMGTNNQQTYSMLEIYDWRVTFARGNPHDSLKQGNFT